MSDFSGEKAMIEKAPEPSLSSIKENAVFNLKQLESCSEKAGMIRDALKGPRAAHDDESEVTVTGQGMIRELQQINLLSSMELKRLEVELREIIDALGLKNQSTMVQANRPRVN